MGVTPFDEFRRRKDRQEEEERSPEEVAEHNAVCAVYADLVHHLAETKRLTEALDGGLSRGLSQAAAHGAVAEREDIRRLVLGYERLSWRLCGQLHAILEGTRKR